MLTCDVGGQNLGCAGRIKLFVDIFGIKDCTAVRIHQNRGAGIEDRTLRPVFDFVALNRDRKVGLRQRLIIDDLGASR